MYCPGQRWGAGVEVEQALGGVGVGEQALGAGPATFAGESSTVSWQVAYAHREASMRGVAAHDVVFELAEDGLDLALGAVGVDDVDDRPVVAVGDQDPFAEDLGSRAGWAGSTLKLSRSPAGTSPVSLG
jgi:hypothetical protein